MFTNALRNARSRNVGELNHDYEKCREALKRGSRCWAHFSSEVDSGRDLFRRLEIGRIRLAAEEIAARNRGGAFSAALAQEWKKEDHLEWDKRAREYVDIYQ